jgi:23S rRNA (cytosine1962-C5)-methyltransferase
VLNGFAYTGGFGIFAAKGGAKWVTSVDSSETALRLAQKNWQGNTLTAAHGEFVHADMFTYLHEIDEQFDLTVLDPPPFIRRRQDLSAGLKGYKEINRLALQTLRPGGQLFTFSCSQHLSIREFFQIVQFAAADAQRTVQVLKHLGPAADHPINLAHAEGTYLKGLWLRVGD